MNKLIQCLAVTIATATAASAAPYYVNANVGYLVDTKEAIFSAQLGYDVARSTSLTQSVEVEVAYTSDSESGVDLDLVPVLANFRLTAPVNGQLDVSSGIGLGFTRTKLAGFGLSDSDNAFTAQGFASFAYKVAPKVAVTGRVRYLWIGNAELFGFKDKVGDDVSVELGLQFRF